MEPTRDVLPAGARPVEPSRSAGIGTFLLRWNRTVGGAAALIGMKVWFAGQATEADPSGNLAVALPGFLFALSSCVWLLVTERRKRRGKP